MKMGMIVIAALVVGFAVWWTVAYPSGTWRYKMTVTVETPEGLKSGSAVREVHVQRGWAPLPEMKPSVSLKGEAIAVDLGERGVLFALLHGYRLGYNYARSLPFYVFPSGRGGTTVAGLKYYSTLKAGPVDISPEWYPKFVHFKDSADPKTVKLVLEMEPCIDPETVRSSNASYCITKDRFAEIYGEGVRLKSVTVEMTDEEVTRGVVERYMPSYANQREYMDWLLSLSYGDPRRIGPDAFGSVGVMR